MSFNMSIHLKKLLVCFYVKKIKKITRDNARASHYGYKQKTKNSSKSHAIVVHEPYKINLEPLKSKAIEKVYLKTTLKGW
jgi:endonuclease IV